MMWIALLTAQLATAGEIYKWTDENGRVHFGDSGQGGRPAEKIAVEEKKPKELSQQEMDEMVRQGREGFAKFEEERAKREERFRESEERMKQLSESEPARPKGTPKCATLARKIIEATEDDEARTALSRQFDRECPRLAYDCLTYESNPKRNFCRPAYRMGREIVHNSNQP
ncbi:MAG TPA: DUF4124 domain-containing protein [Fluviicoccus sp.]|nr:DUF4124 domain-containing protein [Fluviicoccus sp.]